MKVLVIMESDNSNELMSLAKAFESRGHTVTIVPQSDVNLFVSGKQSGLERAYLERKGEIIRILGLNWEKMTGTSISQAIVDFAEKDFAENGNDGKKSQQEPGETTLLLQSLTDDAKKTNEFIDPIASDENPKQVLVQDKAKSLTIPTGLGGSNGTNENCNRWWIWLQSCRKPLIFNSMEAFYVDIPTISRNNGQISFWEILVKLALILPLIYILKTDFEINHNDNRNDKR